MMKTPDEIAATICDDFWIAKTATIRAAIATALISERKERDAAQGNADDMYKKLLAERAAREKAEAEAAYDKTMCMTAAAYMGDERDAAMARAEKAEAERDEAEAQRDALLAEASLDATTIRAETIEACAQVAQDHAGHVKGGAMTIAAAIRALKDQPDGQT
jgi:hypothetical protein